VAQRITQATGGLPEPREASSSGSSDGKDSDSTFEPHIGTDEAGKGDYFGPLVSAAVYVDRETAARFRQLGVRDSKTLSDRRVRELAEEIKHLANGGYAVTPINPRKFNELYEQFRREKKNLNSLLGWGHARSIEKLLGMLAGKRLPVRYVLVDQFADRHYIEERTRRAEIPIHQRHKAEADIAVAAASILARDGFLEWIERWSERTQVSLAKGASPQVIQAAKEFVRRWGAKWLGDVAKLNFRTTREVLEGENTDADTLPPHWANDAAENAGEG
jgi:ribonuclease HIII